MYMYLKRFKGMVEIEAAREWGGDGWPFQSISLCLIYFVMSVSTCCMTRYFCLLGCLSFHKIFMRSIEYLVWYMYVYVVVSKGKKYVCFLLPDEPCLKPSKLT